MVFVTGGTGLLGSHLLIELTQEHDNITAIYRNKSKIDTVRKSFDFYLSEKAELHFNRINWTGCDIHNTPRMEQMMIGHTVIYHCAAMVSFARRDFQQSMEVKRYGTVNM